MRLTKAAYKHPGAEKKDRNELCSNSQIYLTSLSERCWSYLHKMPMSQVQLICRHARIVSPKPTVMERSWLETVTVWLKAACLSLTHNNDTANNHEWTKTGQVNDQKMGKIHNEDNLVNQRRSRGLMFIILNTELKYPGGGGIVCWGGDGHSSMKTRCKGLNQVHQNACNTPSLRLQ